jgi:hypothetical protein
VGRNYVSQGAHKRNCRLLRCGIIFLRTFYPACFGMDIVMQSKNKPAPTKAERAHIERVKELNCSVCDAPGPSECHEIKQGQWFTSVSLCADCHRNPLLGLHGQKRAWLIRKVDELDALAVTVQRLVA